MRFTDLIKEGQRCWKGYEKKGTKMLFGKRVNNCVKKEHIDFCVNCGGILLHESLDENLKKWFKDKWVRMGPGGKIRGSCGGKSKGEGKPKCLPAKKAYALGKKVGRVRREEKEEKIQTQTDVEKQLMLIRRRSNEDKRNYRIRKKLCPSGC